MANTNSLLENKTIEMYEQQLHELRTQLRISQMMEDEYYANLELQKKKYENVLEETATKIKALEKRDMQWSNKVDSLEQERTAQAEDHKAQMLEMKHKVEELEEQLKQRNGTNNVDVIKTFQSQNSDLLEREAEYQVKYERLAKENVELGNKLEELTCTYNETNECLLATKEDLASCLESLKNAQDELALTKSELEMLKSSPLPEGQKGNSLFAEVEDRRQVMKKYLDSAVAKYRYMKKLYLDKCTEASKCMKDYVSLSKKLEDLEYYTVKEEKHLTDSYKSRIKELENEVETLQKQKPPYIIRDLDDKTMKFMDVYLESSREEVKKLKEEVDVLSVRALFKNEELLKLKKQLQKTEADLLQARVQVALLQGQLQDKEDLRKRMENIPEKEGWDEGASGSPH